MTRTLITAFATLGMIIAGAVTAVLLVGVTEGIRQLPDPVATVGGVVVFLAAMGLAGRVAVDVGGPHAVRGVLVAAGLVLLGGWLAARATESNGEGLEVATVAQLGAGLGVLLLVSVWSNRRLAVRPHSTGNGRGLGRGGDELQ